MTIAQLKAARRRHRNDPRYRKSQKSAEARKLRRERDKKKAERLGRTFSYQKKK